ncbi:MAG: Protein export cytoplasm protein SecA ATPase helicase [Chthonomonadaceae bacterium]|nr:Protein export cytoplasm protein SecA ATPase helicase [Chthonomonadaceae bacterium]
MSESQIVYTIEETPEAAEVAELYRRAGLNRPVDDLERMGRMIAHANLILCARDGERLVGIARALTDFSHCCYLADLAVAEEYQRQGIGKALIERVYDAIGEEAMLLLLSAPKAMPYYPHVGFQAVENGWILPRRR